jgi:hypothetical protein
MSKHPSKTDQIPFRYPSIQGPESRYLSQPCVAFEKYDGSNLYFAWEQGKGWTEFGTRRFRITPDHELFGHAWELFNAKYAKGIVGVMRQYRDYRNTKRLIAFCEYFGPNTFAGLHHPGDEMELKLFDIYLPDADFVSPVDFSTHFGQLDIAPVIYQGAFNWQFVLDVYNGKYPVREGAVAKGRMVKRRRKGVNEYEVWMAKFKTKAYLEALQQRAGANPDLQREYEEMQQMHSALMQTLDAENGLSE